MNERPLIADAAAIAQKGRELTVQIHDLPREIEPLLRLIKAEGIGILAHSWFNGYNGTRLLVVSEEPDAACAVAQAAGYECRTEPVVLVVMPYQVGLAALLGMHLREVGIGILYSYASWEAGRPAVFVFKTTQDDLAIQILNVALEDWPQAHPVYERFESAVQTGKGNMATAA